MSCNLDAGKALKVSTGNKVSPGLDLLHMSGHTYYSAVQALVMVDHMLIITGISCAFTISCRAIAGLKVIKGGNSS